MKDEVSSLVHGASAYETHCCTGSVSKSYWSQGVGSERTGGALAHTVPDVRVGVEGGENGRLPL